MLPTPIWEDKAKDLFRLRVHSDASCDFGGRSRSKIMKLLLKLEAAGIEPGHFDDLGAVSPRHLAPVRDSPRGDGWSACAIMRGEPPSRGYRGPTGPWRSRAEESAALYGTDLLFVLRELIHALVVDLIRQRGLRTGGESVTGSRLGSDLGLAY